MSFDTFLNFYYIKSLTNGNNIPFKDVYLAYKHWHRIVYGNDDCESEWALAKIARSNGYNVSNGELKGVVQLI